MAKAKKKETLTPEERLQAALVPESEQPYKVPENWCWVKVGEFSTLYRGVTYKKQDAHTEKQDQDYLILRGGNILEGTIDTEANDNVYVNQNLVQDEQLVQPYDIIIVSSTGSSKVIGRAGISYEKYNDVAFGAFLTLVRPNKEVVKPFISYYFQSNLYRNRIQDLASGVNINNIKASYITESPLPLPPLPEQQRIVDRIESLFDKLDEAKQKAQDALDSFETRKAAILHKAFTGELTAKWRKEHGVGMESWENTTMGEIASFHQGVQVAVNEQFGDYEENRVRFIRIVDYTQGTEKERYVSCDKIRNESYVKDDEIVMVRYGATAGFVGDGIEGLIANNMFVIDVSDNIREYIKVFLKSPAIYNKLNTSGGSTAMPALNFKTVSAIEVPLPSEKEQTEIVRILDGLLAKEQQAKEVTERVLEQIDLMKKSILARAFRGELGTNDPAEESAVELVKKIIL